MSASFFKRDPVVVARDLVGVTLLVNGAGGLIVETEAYTRDDPASHSFVGVTKRNASMFGPAARAYVYRSYGMHWCLNFVCGDQPGNAVLIRAVEPKVGLDQMRARRRVADDRLLASGPGRLCQALHVTGALDGLPLDQPPFQLFRSGTKVPVSAAPRVGISRAADRLWRFGAPGSRFVSRPL